MKFSSLTRHHHQAKTSPIVQFIASRASACANQVPVNRKLFCLFVATTRIFTDNRPRNDEGRIAFSRRDNFLRWRIFGVKSLISFGLNYRTIHLVIFDHFAPIRPALTSKIAFFLFNGPTEFFNLYIQTSFYISDNLNNPRTFSLSWVLSYALIDFF